MLVYMFFFFFFNDTATTEIYTLSLHDALPICGDAHQAAGARVRFLRAAGRHLLGLFVSDWVQSGVVVVILSAAWFAVAKFGAPRSEEHTSELQSPCNLVCRLLLEKKNRQHYARIYVFFFFF